MKKPELIAPAGDWPSLQAAIEAKADAIYFGLKQLNMRATTKNFELEELKKITELCHKNKVKAYLALNTIIYDNEADKVRKILEEAKIANIDGIHAWDFLVIKECERLGLPVHLSTQASISNFEAIKILKSRFDNVTRIILARELSLSQIKDIRYKIKQERLNVEIETFIHGAMCVSISGRCFLSQFTFNKSANRGDCLQPCRRQYLIEDIEEKHQFELRNNYIMSPKDLCTLQFIEKLIETGIDAFKIEGRNRAAEYVKKVTECYREAIDFYFKGQEKLNRELSYLEPRFLLKKNKNCQKNIKKESSKNEKQIIKKQKEFEKNFKTKKQQLLKKLRTVYNRGFSSGFYLGKPINEWTDEYGSKATKIKIYVGKIRNYFRKIGVTEIKLETHDLKVGDNIMVQGNKTGVIEDSISSMEKNHKKIKEAKKDSIVAIKIKKEVRPNDKIFLIKSKS